MLALGSGDGLHKIDLRDRSVVTHIKSKEIVSLDFGGDPFQVYWSDRRSLNLLSLHNGAWNEMPFRRGEIMSIESRLWIDWQINCTGQMPDNTQFM